MTTISEGPIERIEDMQGKYGYTVLYSLGEYDSYQVMYISFDDKSFADSWLLDPKNSYINPIAFLGR